VDEVLPGYEGVLQQPKLPLTTTLDARNQHWQTLLDADGFTVNGKAISLPPTSVTTTKNPAQLTAVFDNGFSLPQLPKSMVDAIYSGVSGAEYDTQHNLWTIPCKSEINVAFKFAGVTIPVHPLDTVITLGVKVGPNDKCVGSFQPITFDSDNQLDMILGMAFLRNVYMLNSFGSLAEGNSTTDAPYIQLLSLTNDTNRAHTEFTTVRLKNGAMPRFGGAGVFVSVAALIAAFAMW
jgi:hypothetical protein